MVFDTLPDFGVPVFAATQDSSSQHYIKEGMQETGAANLVTSVILDYRAYDTLGEVTVLFTAILGSLTILRIKSQKKKEGRAAV